MTTAIPVGATVTVTVVRPATPNSFGDPTGTATETALPGCVVSPQGSGASRVSAGTAEATELADTVSSRLLLVAPAAADLLATDRVRIPDGTLWEVVGDPQRYTSPFTGAELTTAELERVSG